MCMGPSKAEKRAAAAAERAQKAAAAASRADAREAKAQEIAQKAKSKREDIDVALTGRTQRQGRRGGAGRQSLLTSASSGAGYASRFR